MFLVTINLKVKPNIYKTARFGGFRIDKIKSIYLKNILKLYLKEKTDKTVKKCHNSSEKVYTLKVLEIKLEI